MAFTPIATAMAAPISVPTQPKLTVSQDVEQVRHRHHRRGFYRYNRGYYYNGHRGYRHRPGRHYRRYNDFWFPLAAFGIGAAITSQPRVIYRDAPRRHYRSGYSRAHYRWCDNRYRSYRASDNTFQPYNGPRRQCYSPYD
nr:BA14K family protein [Notoacmeibacter ruber]